MLVANRHNSLCSSEETAKVMRAVLAHDNEIDRSKEHFWAIGLDVKNRIQYIDLVSLGTLNSSLVHPRETFRQAIMKGIAALIVCHNHPSGDLRPSQEDILLTRRLTQAGDIIGINVLDHVIISDANEDKFSFRDNGLISYSEGV